MGHDGPLICTPEKTQLVIHVGANFTFENSRITELAHYIASQIRVNDYVEDHLYLRPLSVIQLQKKHFTKKCKTHSCRDALPQKKQREQAITYTAMGSQTIYLHITAQCITE